MGAVGGHWGLFRGPITHQITPISRFTLSADMLAPEYWNGTLRLKTTIMVKLIHPHICLDPGWGLGVLGGMGGRNIRPWNTSKWIIFRKCSLLVVCFDFIISVIILALEKVLVTMGNGIMLGHVIGIMDQFGRASDPQRDWSAAPECFR
jgi:hypothetical protein